MMVKHQFIELSRMIIFEQNTLLRQLKQYLKGRSVARCPDYYPIAYCKNNRTVPNPIEPDNE